MFDFVCVDNAMLFQRSLGGEGLKAGLTGEIVSTLVMDLAEAGGIECKDTVVTFKNVGCEEVLGLFCETVECISTFNTFEDVFLISMLLECLLYSEYPWAFIALVAMNCSGMGISSPRIIENLDAVLAFLKVMGLGNGGLLIRQSF